MYICIIRSALSAKLLIICFSHFTRFSDRILIPHKKTRNLLSQFAKGFCDTDELLSLCEKHAPFLKEMVQHLVTKGIKGTQSQCPSEWMQFVAALATSSPVCALIHPSDTLLKTLRGLESGQNVHSIENLQYLQQQVPVLFDLIHRIKSFPSFLSPVLKEMADKAELPFQAILESSSNLPLAHDTQDIAFFPHLPLLRPRGAYLSDKAAQSKICTKHRVGHPTLLPGLFTLFCKHGICIYVYTHRSFRVIPALLASNYFTLQEYVMDLKS